MTAEHLLQVCPSYNRERTETWERAVTLQDKLYGDAVNLKLTTILCADLIWRNQVLDNRDVQNITIPGFTLRLTSVGPCENKPLVSPCPPRAETAKPRCMGGCVSRHSFTVNKQNDLKFSSTQPFLFSLADAECVLRDADPNDYLLYRDDDSDKIILSVRLPSYIRHYRITELNSLYYLSGQPYAYLDSIVLYHRKHKLNGFRLNKQAHLSARIVRAFAHRLANSNGNLHLYANRNLAGRDSMSTPSNDRSETSTKHSRNSSDASLLTSSSNSTGMRHRL